VARQWCGRLGKLENCQVGAFAALSRGERFIPIDGRLYLPKEWVEDRKRCKRACIPQAEIRRLCT
jgi:SRSO17 transposase